MQVSLSSTLHSAILNSQIGIKYEDLAYLSGLGFPVMGTNNGHNGTTGVDFYHNPDVVEDYAYRA